MPSLLYAVTITRLTDETNTNLDAASRATTNVDDPIQSLALGVGSVFPFDGSTPDG